MNLKITELSLNQAIQTRQKFFSRKSLSDINPEFFQGNFHKNVAWLANRDPDPDDYFVTIPEPILQKLISIYETDENCPNLSPTTYILSIFYRFVDENYRANTKHNLSHPLSKQRTINSYAEVSYDFLRSIHHKHKEITKFLQKHGFIEIQSHSYSDKAISKNANHATRFIPKDGLFHTINKTNFTQFYLSELVELSKIKDKYRLRKKNDKLPSSFIINPLKKATLLKEISTYKSLEINTFLKNFDSELEDKEKCLQKINQKYENILLQISKLENETYLITDKFGHRRHTSISGLPKYTRKYLIDSSITDRSDILNGLQDLMSFDMKASLPVILGTIVYQQEKTNLKDHTNSPVFEESLLYYKYCESKHGIYNFIKRQMNVYIKDKHIHITEKFTHKDVKSLYIQYMSARNDMPIHKIKNKQGNFYSETLTNIFIYTLKATFPTIVKYLQDMKKQGYKKVTSLLQRHEAKFIHSCHKMLVDHGINATTVYDAILVPRKYKKEATNMLKHMIKNAELPTRFVPEEMSRIKPDTNKYNLESIQRANEIFLDNKIKEVNERKAKKESLYQQVIKQAEENIFLNKRKQRSLVRKARAKKLKSNSVDSVNNVNAIVGDLEYGSRLDPLNIQYSATSVVVSDLINENKVAEAAEAVKRQQEQGNNREKNKTISITTGSEPTRFRPSVPRFSPLTS